MKNLGFISKFLIEINDLKVTSLGYDLHVRLRITFMNLIRILFEVGYA